MIQVRTRHELRTVVMNAYCLRIFLCKSILCLNMIMIMDYVHLHLRKREHVVEVKGSI